MTLKLPHRQKYYSLKKICEGWDIIEKKLVHA